ncbi:MAG: phosphatase PAP2/dual specificity phosphatase family protein [Pirellulales bacterium]
MSTAPTTADADSPRELGLRREALLRTVALSLLFMVVYGGTSYITSLRSDVGTWYYAWEKYIPFIPLMVIPYMSIDLFFVAAPFLCRDRSELRILSRRIVLGVLVAGGCFLLYPLQLGVERPSASGWIGALWDWFKGMDRPYNLLPSLHITLRTILADLYVRKTARLARLATHVWFSLIGFSTLFTWQHHVVDVIGGFILATLCFYLVSDVPWRLPVVPNPTIGWRYAAISVVLFTLATISWPWGAILIWPAVSVAILTAGYFALGPSVFRKQGGRLRLSAKIVMAPVLVAQYLSLRYYQRQCNAWDAVATNVWLGRALTEAEAAEAVRQGVTAVVDLSNEFSEPAPFLAANYRHLPVLDLTAPTQAQLVEAASFIEQEAERGVVYVHCKIGYSRSAAVVAAWLLATGRAGGIEAAIAQLRTVRPTIVIRPEIRQALDNFASAIPPHLETS